MCVAWASGMHWLLHEVVETVEDDVDMLGVGALIEYGVEVDANLGICANECRKVLVFLPGARRVALDESVRLVTLEPRFDEREQKPLGEVDAVARIDIAAHALGMHDEPFDEPGEAVEHVVERE